MPDPGQLFFAVPIVAIIFGVSAGIVKSILSTYERVHMAKMQNVTQTTAISDNQMTALRDEIAALRDTTTQHAISLQHSIERLERRVDFLEHKTTSPTPSSRGETTSTIDAPVQQVVGRS